MTKTEILRKVKMTGEYVDYVCHGEILTENLFTTIVDGTEGVVYFFIKKLFMLKELKFCRILP